jgi:iron complex transport system substrate-binding protein
MKYFLPIFLAAALAAPALAAERIVSTAGAITETLYAIGANEELVAADVSSVYPVEATKLPSVGYARQLSAEGILSVNPTMVLVTEDAGPPEVLQQLEAAKVKVVKLSNKHTPEAAVERIVKIGEAVNRPAEAAKLADSVRADLDAAKALVAGAPGRPTVLFIYARGGGTMNVSGAGTSAEAIIELAGGKNAVTGYENYKPLTAEGAVAAAPDFILVTSRGLEASGGVDGLLKQPGLALTPAGKEKRVIAMDDLFLLGFGPRVGQAAKELCEKLHADSKSAQR